MKRFKKIFVLVLVVCAASFMFAGCGDSSNHTVTFMKATSIVSIKGKIQCSYVSVKTISVEDGGVIGSAPVNTQNGSFYRFAGWYTEKECLNQWNLYKDEVRSNLTLYPKYEKVSLSGA